MRRLHFVLLIFLFSTLAVADPPKISPPTPDLQKQLTLSPFYKKSLDDHGLFILSSEKTSDHALLEAAWIIDHMLAGRDDLRKALIDANVRVVVMAHDEFTTNVPEHSRLTPKAYWDKRARGLGGTRTDPVVSCGEENLLNFKEDPYTGENILIHEFSHILQKRALRDVDPDLYRKITDAYLQAKTDGLWKGTYAMTDYSEYFAEAVQSWFDCNAANNAAHGDVDTREKLQKYDPRLAELLAQVFRGNEWRYTPTTRRSDAAHLAGFDRATAPTFAWPPEILKAARELEKK
ncbi:MAG TPA: hypothetical protein VGQ99_15725 [Tepidisphaeraceae bacterium]|nr:hypothetical protein [Tepidisphaeraceae bacterium]